MCRGCIGCVVFEDEALRRRVRDDWGEEMRLTGYLYALQLGLVSADRSIGCYAQQIHEIHWGSTTGAHNVV
jgi:hypothetical protein